MLPLISVVVPVYRVEDYLGRCVDSLLMQSYENLEIILVDDGSPDGCPAICEGYKERDGRIRVIHQENAGLSGARNAGIDAAEGEYLAFVDSDDYVSPDFIGILYGLIEQTGADIAQCRFAYVRGESLAGASQEGQSYHIYRGISLMEKLYGEETEATNFVVAWNKLYKRELFAHIRYPKGRIHEDEATTYQLFHEAKKLVFTDSALYGYYTGNTGSITAVFSQKRLQWFTAHEERAAFFEKNGYEKLLPQAFKKLCDACITFYFRCTDEVEDADRLRKSLKKRLIRYRLWGAGQIKRLPVRTRLGYRIFGFSPALYRQLLRLMRPDEQ